MGMSASQARLLSITSRLTNNELQAQLISNSKVRLATESENVTNKYMNALSSTQLMFTSYDDNGELTKVNLTPAVIYNYEPCKNQYLLINSSDKVIVSDEDAKNFENTDNLQAFLACYNLTYDGSLDINETLSARYEAELAKWQKAMENYNEECVIYEQELEVYNVEYNAYLIAYQEYLDSLDNANANDIPTPPVKPKEPTEPRKPDKPDEVHEYTLIKDKDKAQWYTNLWYKMNNSESANVVNKVDFQADDNWDSVPENVRAEFSYTVKNCDKNVSQTMYTALDNNLLNSPEWLQFALEHGIINIEQATYINPSVDSFKVPEMTGEGYTWKSIIYTNAADIRSQDDEKKIAIAEAQYKKSINEIQAKDKKYDQDLKKLDTEHNALQTEFDSVKELISKNVDRSFKAFS